MAFPFEVAQDWTVRPITAVAAPRQLFERPPHSLDLQLLALQLRGASRRERLDVSAGAAPVLPERKQLPESTADMKIDTM